MLTLFSTESSYAQKTERYVRIAKIKVDSTQLIDYTVALQEGIKTAMQVEPGVLMLYAVADKNDATTITVLEIYADVEAYKKHIETPYFKKYKTTTMAMVKSLELVDVTPIALESKPR